MDTNHNCSHFIGQYNHMISDFGYLNPESVVTYLNLIVVLFMVHLYGNLTVIVLVTLCLYTMEQMY